MKANNLFLGVATGAILIGALFGVGCKSKSNSNSNATKTAQAMVTPAGTMMSSTPAAMATTVSQTQTTATYTIVLRIGPAEEMTMSAATPMSGEVMVPMPGVTPSMMTTDQGQTVNHHLEVHITNTATGAVVTDTVPAITITNTSTNASRQITDVTQMYDATVGSSDAHFGNNVYLPDGQYAVTVVVGQETAQFTAVTVSNGATPAPMSTASMMTTGTPEAMMTPATTPMP